MGEHLVTKEQVAAAKKRYEEMQRKLQSQEEKKALRIVRDYCAVYGKDMSEFLEELQRKIESKKAQNNSDQPEHTHGTPGVWEGR